MTARVAKHGTYWCIYAGDKPVMLFTSLEKALGALEDVPATKPLTDTADPRRAAEADPYPYARQSEAAKRWLGKSYLLAEPTKRLGSR